MMRSSTSSNICITLSLWDFKWFSDHYLGLTWPPTSQYCNQGNINFYSAQDQTSLFLTPRLYLMLVATKISYSVTRPVNSLRTDSFCFVEMPRKTTKNFHLFLLNKGGCSRIHRVLVSQIYPWLGFPITIIPQYFNNISRTRSKDPYLCSIWYLMTPPPQYLYKFPILVSFVTIWHIVSL